MFQVLKASIYIFFGEDVRRWQSAAQSFHPGKYWHYRETFKRLSTIVGRIKLYTPRERIHKIYEVQGGKYARYDEWDHSKHKY